MIITVGRECGSGGHAIGEALAAHYGIRCYDRHILVSGQKSLLGVFPGGDRRLLRVRRADLDL